MARKAYWQDHEKFIITMINLSQSERQAAELTLLLIIDQTVQSVLFCE